MTISLYESYAHLVVGVTKEVSPQPTPNLPKQHQGFFSYLINCISSAYRKIHACMLPKPKPPTQAEIEIKKDVSTPTKSSDRQRLEEILQVHFFKSTK